MQKRHAEMRHAHVSQLKSVTLKRATLMRHCKTRHAHSSLSKSVTLKRVTLMRHCETGPTRAQHNVDKSDIFLHKGHQFSALPNISLK
jgi:transketolase N-terminal domain/subunit